ncbi:MAG: 30S ribosomal protein S12 methylthiotransferase RimO [Coriobacteriales bacterium]|nr:30S ribosomal protein S12 methylthiotransferase RimO [Coriobacteriales bacterium]
MTSKSTPAVGFITLGCPKNEVDTDRMKAAVTASSYRVVPDLEDADVVVVNTCSFIQDATEESIQTVLDVARGWLPAGEGRRLVVAGCMPSRYGADLAIAMPEVDAFVPVTEEHALLDVLGRLMGMRSEPTACAPRRAEVGPSAYLQVSDGCHRECAFCTIPAIRGPYRSRSLDDIVAEAGELIAAGAREIVLIGQDVSSWGRDLPGDETLADVVRAVSAVEDLAWLRLMYVQPDGVTDDLLDAMASSPKVCRYLDIPLQHASARVLRSMRRTGSAESFLALVTKIRRAMPDVALRTTLIAGYPGETRTDVDQLVRFLEAAAFDYVGVFAYSAEEGTQAAALPAQVPVRTKRRRAQRLRDVSDAIGFSRASGHLDEELEVLVEGFDPDEDSIVGRWRGQAPEVDGIVLLDRGEPGEIVRARVVDVFGYDLEGEVV